MFRTRLNSIVLTCCTVAIVLGWLMLFAQSGDAAKPRPGGNGDVERRLRDLEVTMADLVQRVERLEGRRPRRDDGNAGGISSFRELVAGKAAILADDGTFLGIISEDVINSKSISNSVGRHGSTVGSESIFNEVGRYGSSVSTTSARNDLASRPPKVYLNDKFVGYLTTNNTKSPRIDTDALVAYLKSQQ